MEPNIKIDESLIPMNFGWRAGIGTHVDDVIDSFEKKKEYKIDNNETIGKEFLNEYNESIWYSILADIEDSMQQFMFQFINERTCESIKATIIQIIDCNVSKYPYMKSYSFQKYLKEKRKQVIDELMYELESYDCEHRTYCDGWIYAIVKYNKLVINKNKILNYILFEY